MNFDSLSKMMISQGRKRLFVQQLVRSSAAAFGAMILIAAILFACTQCGIPIPHALWAALLLPWLILAIIAWPKRLSDVEIARRIDKANSFSERLSSAISFKNSPDISPWMQVQIDDTASKLDDPALQKSFIDTAFGISKPVHIKQMIWMCAAAALIAAAPSIFQHTAKRFASSAPDAPNTMPPSEENAETAPNLDPIAADLRQEQAEEMLKAAQELDDPELKSAAEELKQIIDDDKAGKLSAKEYQRRLAELEKKLDALNAPTKEEQKSFDQSIKDAVQELTDMKEDPETKELAEALEKNDYDKAADILRDLVSSTSPEDKKKLEKLAKMFGDLAKKIDPTDPELKEALKRNKDLVDQLEKEFKNHPLSDEDKKAFNNAAQKLKEDEKKQQELRNKDNTSKALDKMQKALNKTAKDLDNPQNQDAQNKQNQDAQNAQNQDAQNAQNQDAQNAQNQDAQNTQNQDAQNKQNQDAQNPQNQDAQNKQNQGQNKGSQEGQEGPDGQNAQEQNAQDPKPGRDGKDGQNGEQSAEEALRNAAAQKKAQEQRDKLKDLADQMKKDAQTNQEGKDTQAQQRQENMQDYLERAKGQKKEDEKRAQESKDSQGQEGQQNQGQQGKEEQSGQKDQQGDQGSDSQSQEGQQNQGQQEAADQGQDKESGRQAGGEQAGQDQGEGADGQPESNTPSLGSSGGHEKTEGEATSMDIKTHDEKLSGMTSEQTTDKIIETAAQNGFASESYKEVYQTYEKAAEEILETESVPQGYKNYVDKYFDMIRPQK